MSATKTCAVPGCHNSIRSAHIMCGRHWAAVPNPKQRDVYHALNRYRNSDGSALALQNLRDKQQAAIDAVAGRQPQAAAS